MELQLTESELAFRDELRDWLADHLVGEFKDFNGQGGPCDDYGWDLRLAWDKELSKDGWLGLGWPTEYGGRPATLNEEITFHVELPGMKQEDIDVQFDGKMLSITGKREFAEQENKDHYVRVERRYGTFERTFTINASVKKDEVTATYKDGILTVVLPKGNGESNHKIAITASEN